jgi:hypothetical protein
MFTKSSAEAVSARPFHGLCPPTMWVPLAPQEAQAAMGLQAPLAHLAQPERLGQLG